MLPAKAMFALGAAVIAGTFVALVITSRGKTEDQLEDESRLERYGEQQVKLAAGDACHDAVGHAVSAAADFLTSRYGDGAPDEIRAIAIHRCTADDWSSEVVRCLQTVTSDNEMQRCISRLEDYQRRALEAEMKAFDARPRAAPDAGVDASDLDPYGYDDNPLKVDIDDAAVALTGDLPLACVAYQDLIARLAACDKLPQASRDAMKQAFDSMKQSWSAMGSMPPAARDAMDQACKQASDALRQIGTGTCGW